MKLIVGLGNPGKEYKYTRHNVGFIVIDNYLGNVKWKIKHEAYFYMTEINDEKVIFLKPLTYMNLSGLSVVKFVKYNKINFEDILVIHDDLDIPLGSYKIKRNSSSGGHNGIKSIINELNSNEFCRLKIGINKPIQSHVDKYVLAKFSTSEFAKINSNMECFNEIITSFITSGIEKTMALYNS